MFSSQFEISLSLTSGVDVSACVSAASAFSRQMARPLDRKERAMTRANARRNWLRTLESIPPYWESFREALYQEIGNPETQREFLIETSPLFHADKITKPLIVLQGKNDPRVILAESDDIVEAVRKNGVPVEYVVFDDEGHGFTKKKNQIEGYGRILAFLDTHLKGTHAAP